MKIYSNPNFPKTPRKRKSPRQFHSGSEGHSLAFLDELAARNEIELARLREKHDLHEEKADAHTHRVVGQIRSVKPSGALHNRRFYAVTGEAIEGPGGHIHELILKTEPGEYQIHSIRARTGPPIPTQAVSKKPCHNSLTAVAEIAD